VTVSRKAALSLLISVLLFAVFIVLAYTGLFGFLELRFYRPSVISSLDYELKQVATSLDSFLDSLQTKISGVIAADSVKRSFLPGQNPEDILERSGSFQNLIESERGLQWCRFIDSHGIRLYYSTNPQDILRQDRVSVTYHNYYELSMAHPYEEIASQSGGSAKYIPDPGNDSILVSIPFYDSNGIFRGTALFSLSIRALVEQLIGDERISTGEYISLISNPPGLLIGRPAYLETTLLSQITALWKERLLSPGKIVHLSTLNSPSYEPLVLFSAETNHGLFIFRPINENLLPFPQTMKTILLICFILTAFLIVFLI